MAATKGGAHQQSEQALEISRGDFVLVVSVGDYGKPRPALVVQSDLYNGTHHSVTICLVNSTLVDAPLFRISIKPLKRNGLSVASQVMVDKVQSARRDRIKEVIGSASQSEMAAVDAALRGWLGIET
jgi:mRNA interferase MazF